MMWPLSGYFPMIFYMRYFVNLIPIDTLPEPITAVSLTHTQVRSNSVNRGADDIYPVPRAESLTRSEILSNNELFCTGKMKAASLNLTPSQKKG